MKDRRNRSGTRNCLPGRLLLDTNIIDRLDEDSEVLNELLNSRSLLCFITEVQLAELTAIPDEIRRNRLIELVRTLCRQLHTDQPAMGKHSMDSAIAAAAIAHNCCLVSCDIGLLEHATAAGAACLSWDQFISKLFL